MDKRSQTEILGLVVIVIILIFAFMIGLKFYMMGRGEHVSKEIVSDMVVKRTVLVLMDTKLECKAVQVQDVVRDCADGIVGLTYCDGRTDPCAEIEYIARDVVLPETFGEWGLDYTMTFTRIPGDTPIIGEIPDLVCKENRKSRRYGDTWVIVELDPPEKVHVELFVCPNANI